MTDIELQALTVLVRAELARVTDERDAERDDLAELSALHSAAMGQHAAVSSELAELRADLARVTADARAERFLAITMIGNLEDQVQYLQTERDRLREEKTGGEI